MIIQSAWCATWTGRVRTPASRCQSPRATRSRSTPYRRPIRPAYSKHAPRSARSRLVGGRVDDHRMDGTDTQSGAAFGDLVESRSRETSAIERRVFDYLREVGVPVGEQRPGILCHHPGVDRAGRPIERSKGHLTITPDIVIPDWRLVGSTVDAQCTAYTQTASSPPRSRCDSVFRDRRVIDGRRGRGTHLACCSEV